MSVDSARTVRAGIWCVVGVLVTTVVVGVTGLNGDHVCMVQQKYNITKRVKYRAPMSVRTYEWCFSMPPRCSKWNTEMRDLTRLETEERTAEVAVCCPGYKMKDVSCIPVCPAGKTGNGCSEDCPKGKWGPNCVYECKLCEHGTCSPETGRCVCHDGWQGERCQMISSTPLPAEELTVIKPSIKSASRTDNPSTAPSPALSSSTTTTTVAPTTTILTSTSAPTTPTTIFLTTTMAPKITTRTTFTSPIRVNTTSTISTTSMRTTNPTTEATSVPNSTVETTFQTAKMATIGAKIKPSPHTTTIAILRNITMTKPWTLSTFKSLATTQRELTTVSTKITPLTTKEREMPTTTTTTVVIRTAPTTLPTLPAPRTEATPTTEILTTTSKTQKEKLTTEPIFKEATRKPETTIKTYATTIKFKPKEIWIKPAQKGELSTETKTKPNSDLSKYKSATKKEITTNTTPRTIIVSIIPTSMSYATFKKMALTTSSYVSHKSVTGRPTEAVTRSMSSSTSSPVKKPLSTSTATPFQNATVRLHTPLTNETSITNSMSTNASIPNSSLTTPSTNLTQKPRILKTLSTKQFVTMPTKSTTKVMKTTEKANIVTDEYATTKLAEILRAETRKTNDTKKITTVKPKPSTKVTEDPDDEETFHILTEPEHITAVMGEKGTERSSVDLISVISIAGGVMMTVITVAVVIVMIERCKRPRFEEAKMNSIRMQVMIDNNDGPPPYVRSIFNTPLPEPPSTEKCHYQPISTLDRNLKQFMRPVVVQTISPMMLENFRGILECHYDHLPRRSMEFQTLHRRSMAPSLGGFDEPLQQRPDSLAESTIEALKCEAKLDVIDNTTSEPLYAEIPCWRPPSEHAIEIVNLNGEAVTEL